MPLSVGSYPLTSCDPLRPRLEVAEILKRNVESVSDAKLAPSSPGVKTEGLVQAGHEPCALRVGARVKAASRAMVKYCTKQMIIRASILY